MKNDRIIDVVEWRDSPRPIALGKQSSQWYLSPRLIGALGALLIHVWVVPSVYVRTRSSQPKWRQAIVPAAASASAADGNLVLVILPSMSASNQAAMRLTPVLSLAEAALKSLIDPDPPAPLNIGILPLTEEQDIGASVEADSAKVAGFVGIYTRQIQARIERLWRRPRSPVSANSEESFQCEVQIVQDGRGNVQEILLPHCNESTAWRQSLVIAIQSASPLPAPPDASVFNRSIALNFVGIAYHADADESEYEVPATQADGSEMALGETVGSNAPIQRR